MEKKRSTEPQKVADVKEDTSQETKNPDVPFDRFALPIGLDAWDQISPVTATDGAFYWRAHPWPYTEQEWRCIERDIPEAAGATLANAIMQVAREFSRSVAHQKRGSRRSGSPKYQLNTVRQRLAALDEALIAMGPEAHAFLNAVPRPARHLNHLEAYMDLRASVRSYQRLLNGWTSAPPEGKQGSPADRIMLRFRLNVHELLSSVTGGRRGWRSRLREAIIEPLGGPLPDDKRFRESLARARSLRSGQGQKQADKSR